MEKPNIMDLEHKKDTNGLIIALSNDDVYIRRNAAQALSKVGDENAVKALMTSAKDSDRLVSIHSINAVKRILKDDPEKKKILEAEYGVNLEPEKLENKYNKKKHLNLSSHMNQKSLKRFFIIYFSFLALYLIIKVLHFNFWQLNEAFATIFALAPLIYIMYLVSKNELKYLEKITLKWKVIIGIIIIGYLVFFAISGALVSALTLLAVAFLVFFISHIIFRQIINFLHNRRDRSFNMYCPYCGARNWDTEQQCSNCGRNFPEYELEFLMKIRNSKRVIIGLFCVVVLFLLFCIFYIDFLLKFIPPTFLLILVVALILSIMISLFLLWSPKFRGDAKICPHCYSFQDTFSDSYSFFSHPYVVPNEKYCILCGHYIKDTLFFIKGRGAVMPSIEITPNKIITYQTIFRLSSTYETVTNEIPLNSIRKLEATHCKSFLPFYKYPCITFIWGKRRKYRVPRNKINKLKELFSTKPFQKAIKDKDTKL